MARSNTLIAGIVFLTCAGPVCANAGDMQMLTGDNVREFIQTTSTITSGHSSDMTEEEIDEYLNKHLAPEAHFRSTMHYTIPGYDVQNATMNVDKEEFIKGVNKAVDTTVQGYENQVQIDDVQIANDGHKATVKTRTMEHGKMPVTDNIEKSEVPVEGMSSCTQIIILSDDHVIQMYSATCTTDIEFMPFDP